MMVTINQGITRQAKTRASAMPHKLMGEAARDAGEQQVPDGVFEDGAVALIDQVAHVVGVRLAELVRSEAHVAIAGEMRLAVSPDVNDAIHCSHTIDVAIILALVDVHILVKNNLTSQLLTHTVNGIVYPITFV